LNPRCAGDVSRKLPIFFSMQYSRHLSNWPGEIELHLKEVFEQYNFKSLFTFETIIIAKNIEAKRITALCSDGMAKNMIVNPIIVITPKEINNFFMSNIPNL